MKIPKRRKKQILTTNKIKPEVEFDVKSLKKKKKREKKPIEKEISFENLTADGLVAMARESHRRVMSRAQEMEDKQKQKVAELTRTEKELKLKIESERELYEKMATDFEKLETEQKEALEKEIAAGLKTEDDVRSGKITITQFHSQGITGEEIEQSIRTKLVEILEKSSDAIRSKRADIARLEFQMYEAQSTIYSLLTTPVKLMQQSYKELADVLLFQLGQIGEYSTARTLKNQAENELLMIERGAALSGYTWSNISLREGFRVRLDPRLPREHIVSLLEQLDNIKGTEQTRVTISFHPPGSHWPGLPIEVRLERE